VRYFQWQIRSRLQQDVVVDWIEGTKLVVRNGMTGATGNIYCGLHEYARMSFVLHLLRHGDLFVDVGANIGSYTILASGVCGARTVAIEPDPDTIRHLERNIVENDLGKITVLRQTAVGESSGSISFTVGKDTTNQVARAGIGKSRPFRSPALTKSSRVKGRRFSSLTLKDTRPRHCEGPRTHWVRRPS